MPDRRAAKAWLSASSLAVALLTLLILGGMIIWFLPYLTRQRGVVAGVPSPPALFEVTEFAVPAHQSACMASVAIETSSRQAQVDVRPAGRRVGAPPLELALRAPGYAVAARLRGGYPGGSETLAITPPRHAVIGTACIRNLGARKLLLAGTVEPRTVSRSAMTIGGRPVTGDVALTFTGGRTSSLLDRLDEVLGHASNLTDRLLPTWLIFLLAALILVGVPAGVIAAFRSALREGAQRPDWLDVPDRRSPSRP